MKRILATALSVIMAMGVLTGCGKEFDASGYVKACLDANVHGEFAEYAKITGTEESELQSRHDEIIDQEMAALDSLPMDEQKKNDFRELFMKLYDSCKYEVGEAVKNEDGTYTVPVTVYQLKAFKTLIQDGQTYIQEYYQTQAEAGNELSQDDLYAAMTDYIYDGLNANVSNPEYGDANTIDVTVGPSAANSRIYEIKSEELQNLLYSMTDAADQ